MKRDRETQGELHSHKPRNVLGYQKLEQSRKDPLSIGFREGNSTPLQHSCLENPMDGGAWWAAVHGVPKSRTRLSDFTFTFHFHALEKEMATHSSVLAWRIPGTEEPGGLPSMGLHRVGHDWSDLTVTAWICQHLDLGLPVSSTVRRYIFLVLKLPVCGTLLYSILSKLIHLTNYLLQGQFRNMYQTDCLIGRIIVIYIIMEYQEALRSQIRNWLTIIGSLPGT